MTVHSTDSHLMKCPYGCSQLNSCDSFQHNLAERHRSVLTDQKLIEIHRQIVTEGGDRTIIPSTSRRNPNDLTKSSYNRGTQILELEAYHAATVSPFQFSKELMDLFRSN